MPSQKIPTNFMFTIHNPDQNLNPDPSRFQYVVWQLECCPTTGTPHYQGYAECKTQLTKQQALDALDADHMHFEKRRGPQSAAIKYCQKEDTRVEGPWERGTPKGPNQGSRNDLLGPIEMIQQGCKMSEVAQECAVQYVKFNRGLHSLRTQYQKERDFKTLFVWLWGPSGTHKSRAAYEAFPDAYFKNEEQWFDHYDQEDVLIWNDFEPCMQSFKQLLRLTDRYPHKVRCKHGTVKFNTKMVIFTASEPPWRQYDRECCNHEIPEHPSNPYHQLHRRLDLVIHMDNVKHPHTLDAQREDVINKIFSLYNENFPCPSSASARITQDPMELTDV